MSQSQPWQLRPFQKRVLKYIMNGRSVILQAPTGSGKTRAALMPFLQNLAHQSLTHQGNRLPLTCLYAVPMRVLANQFYREYDTIVPAIDRHAPTRLAQKYHAVGRDVVAIQTGEQPGDPQFESALTFCTIDQLLASFLAIPYSVGTSRANLNVGGVASSYLVLDEFHLYPLLRNGKSVYGARTTALQMLRLLKSIHTPFVLMTATFSTALLNRLGELLDAEIVTIDDDQELLEIAQGRTRTFYRSIAPMDADTILVEHQQRAGNTATLIVCNTVFRAQALFLRLKCAEENGTRVVLLHSRFSIADRKRLSEEIVHELGPEQWRNGVYHGRDIIVIATQVVEVGLDISTHTLHTENVPANSLIQRAGRCARFAQQQGSVIIYPLPADEEGKAANTLPYDQKPCDLTWDALAQFDRQQVGFREEQKLIDDVHTREDQELLQCYELNEGEILEKIFQSFNSNDRGIASMLIRDVAQVQILIHDQPDEDITEAPWRWQSFSMHPGSLSSKRRWAALQERGKDLDWVCKEAVPVPETQIEADGADGIDNRRQKTIYRWVPVTSPASISKALFITLPRHLACYDSELGFVLLDGQLDLEANGYQSMLLPELVPDHEKYGSLQTSYQGHITGLVGAYKAGIKEDIAFIAQHLEHEMGLSTGTIDQAIRLAIACHDLGKLDQQWQQWAFTWQKFLYEKQNRPAFQLPYSAYCFAKTDNNYSREYREWQRDVQPKRPHHACESVAIGRKLIGTSLGITRTSGKENAPVLRAICGAIAHHHTSQASEYGSVILSAHALHAAKEALHIAHLGSAWSYDPACLDLCIVQGGDLAPETATSPKLTRPGLDSGLLGELETWLYFLIVRALRLADQRADAFSSK
jgi:CRISPR-associated endonuclease/helicase Cas3